MATTTMSAQIEALARAIAVDQIKQDLEFQKKIQELEASQTVERLLTLEAKVSELCQKCWVQSAVADLSFSGDASQPDAFTARLAALESKVEELQQKAWTQEPLSLKD